MKKERAVEPAPVVLCGDHCVICKGEILTVDYVFFEWLKGPAHRPCWEEYNDRWRESTETKMRKAWGRR